MVATTSSPSLGGGQGGLARGVASGGEAAPVAADGGGGVSARPGQGLALATGGGGGASVAEYADYIAHLRERIQTTLRYPLPARRRGLTGTVELELTVQPNGTIGGISVVESSSHPSLDDAALEAVRSLRPMPFPTGIPPRQLRLRLPVVFELH